MSKIAKRIVLGVVALIVACGIGYGVYTYVNHTGFFAPAEAPVEETVVTEVAIGE